MARHKLMAVEPLYAKFKLPRGAKIIGYLKLSDGSDDFEHPIVRQTFPPGHVLAETVRVPVLSAAGEQEWKLTPRGERITPRFTLKRRAATREWVPAYSPQGHIARNFNWKPDPEEQARAQQKVQAQKTMKDLSEALAAVDMTPQEMIERLRGTAGGAAPEPETVEKTEAPWLDPEDLEDFRLPEPAEEASGASVEPEEAPKARKVATPRKRGRKRGRPRKEKLTE
jgi:hypothetical protein